jgi:xanthine dehydrogenase molybdopterin-binding subunit B/xanthine dehydrogenase iron-sulfur cluster and FAD-binding subunit A
VNGKKETLEAYELNPRMTLLEYLREKAIGLTGTKTSCTQGGCGACTVMLTSRNEATGEVEHKSCNACLRPLLSMEGQQVTTTEGIGGPAAPDGFHPVQERIADCNGTQCGFCTPGHVMAMYSLLREKGGEPLSIPEIEDRFDGTICRCTGYRSIMKACHSFASEGIPDEGALYKIAGDEAAPDWAPHDAGKEPPVPAPVAAPAAALSIEASGSKPAWHRALTLAEVAELRARYGPGKKLKMVCGGTSVGVYPDANDETEVFVDISAVKELGGVEMTEAGLVLGATTTLSQLLAALTANAAASESYTTLAKHIKKVANWQVRNVGSWAGNLVMARTHAFASDIATLMMGAGATLKLQDLAALAEAADDAGGVAGGTDCDIHSFLHGPADMGAIIIQSITIPKLKTGEHLGTYRAAMRPNNAHAFVNCAFRATVSPEGVVSDAVLAFGVVQHKAVFATDAEAALNGASLDIGGLAAVLGALETLEVVPEPQYHSVMQPEGKDAYRRNLLSSFVYKFFLRLIEQSGAPLCSSLQTAGSVLIEEKGYSVGQQSFEAVLPENHPGKFPRPKFEAKEQAAGRTIYHNDITLHGQLYCVLVPCVKAPAKVVSIDWTTATAMPGVVEYLDNSDAPGAAGSFAGVADGGEHLFVATGSETLFVGQPVGAIVAKSRREAEAAAKAVSVAYGEPASPGLYTIAEAKAAGAYLSIPGSEDPTHHWGPGEKVVGHGDVDAAIAEAAASGGTVVEGSLEIGGQSHFPMEKHTCVAAPDEQGRMVIYASTQMPDHTRFLAAANTGIPVDKVQVIVKRLGGSYGGKCDKSFWTTMACTVAAKKLGRPVSIQNDIHQDMMLMGTARHPTSVQYKAAVSADGKIAAWDVKSTLNGGRCTGFSTFIAGEVLNNLESVYHIPAFKHECTLVLTNTATNGPVRGPGLVQASTISETIMEHLAASSGIDAQQLRTQNMCDTAQTSVMHGVPKAGIHVYNMPEIWEQLSASSEIVARKAAVEEFNAQSKWKKRGISMTPGKYSHCWLFSAGINVQVSIQAVDAVAMGCPSVKVHQPCIEMGQGLTTKVQMTVACALGCPPEKVYVCATNTDVLPNGGSGVTGGSIGSEGCCAAAQIACDELLERMGHSTCGGPPSQEEFTKMVAAANGIFGIGHEAAVMTAPKARMDAGEDPGPTGKINLTATGIWNPPFAETFSSGEEGSIVSYFTLGAACSEVEIDVLSGEVAVRRADILFDAGHSLNPVIDLGQVEGAFLMGQGFFTQEETIYQKDGTLTSDSTWEYKPPLANQIPTDFRVAFVKDNPLPFGVKKSKAVGEPPLLLSASVFTAVREAIKASRVERGKDAAFALDCPASVDRIQSACDVDATSLIDSLK